MKEVLEQSGTLRLKKRAECLEAFLISVYQQEYKVKEILGHRNSRVLWKGNLKVLRLSYTKEENSRNIAVWLPKGLSQPRLRRFNGIGQLVS